jgi:GT2 family glycosyltransferase
MDISIIVVNYNTRELTLQCLESVKTYLTGTVAYEVIVVDNCSSDGSQAALKNYAAVHTWLTVLESDGNYGFAHANNKGIRIAGGRQILLLNSDAYLINDSLVSAMNYLDATPDLFGCGCTLLQADGTPGVSYGKFPGFLIVLCEVILNKFTRLRGGTPTRTDTVYPIDMPCGAFFLIKHDLLKRIGLLDETYFMYCEETDLARRAWNAGYRIVCYGPAKVVHLGGKSSIPDGNESSKLVAWKTVRLNFYRSWRYYLEKHGFWEEANAVRMLLYVFFSVHYLGSAVLQRKKIKQYYCYELETLHKGWKSSAVSK